MGADIDTGLIFVSVRVSDAVPGVGALLWSRGGASAAVLGMLL